MANISFTIKGTPVPKGRPRFTRNFITFTPAKTVQAEQVVKTAALEAMAVHHKLLENAIALQIYFYMPIPKSWPKAKKIKAAEKFLYHTGKPDIDNLIKLVVDACNGIVYKDDSQLVSISAVKMYSEYPGTEVCFFER